MLVLHQRKRLNQIIRWVAVRQNGLATSLLITPNLFDVALESESRNLFQKEIKRELDKLVDEIEKLESGQDKVLKRFFDVDEYREIQKYLAEPLKHTKPTIDAVVFKTLKTEQPNQASTAPRNDGQASDELGLLRNLNLPIRKELHLLADGQIRVIPFNVNHKIWITDPAIQLMSSQSVRTELEFDDGQEKEFIRLNQLLQNAYFKTRLQKLKELKNAQLADEAIRPIQQQLQDEMIATLLSHQKKWLINIIARQQQAAHGIQAVLGHPALAKKIKLSKERQARLKQQLDLHSIELTKIAFKLENEFTERIIDLHPEGNRIRQLLGD